MINFLNKFSSRQKIIILFLILSLVFLSLIFILSSIFSFNNPYQGRQIEIQNLKEHPETAINPKTLNIIKNMIYRRLKENYKSDLDPKQINDAIIRDKTFSEEYNQKLDLHIGKFKLDIPSIKQSYGVMYQWSKNPESLDQYDTDVYCLPKRELIYEEFECQDLFSSMRGGNDPVLKITPFYGYNQGFDIFADPAPKGQKITVKIRLYSTIPDEITFLKKKAINFLKNHKLYPEDYNIIFTND